MLARAYAIAATYHSEQYDKGGRPYFEHVLAVMQLLNSNDDELKCIALLHDIVEDTAYTFLQMQKDGFSQRVIDGVRAMTKQRGETYEEYKSKVKANHDAVLVKMADLTHNSDVRRIKEPGDKDFERIKKYRQFYTELKDVGV